MAPIDTTMIPSTTPDTDASSEFQSCESADATQEEAKPADAIEDAKPVDAARVLFSS